MKKFYMLMAAIAVTISSFAAVPQKMQHSAQLVPGADQIFVQAMADAQVTILNGDADYTRSFSQGGKTWNMYVTNQPKYQWYEMLNGTTCFEDWPFYFVMMELVSDSDDVMWYILQWPCEYTFSDIWGDEDPEVINTEIVPFSTLCNANPQERVKSFYDTLPSGRLSWFAFDEEDNFMGYAMYPINHLFTNTMSMGGKDVIGLSGTGSEVSFQSFDKNTTETEIYLNLIYSYFTESGGQKVPTGSPMTLTMNPFKSDISLSGFETMYYTWNDMTNIHIFNGGQADEDFLYDEMGYQEVNEAPLTRFYLSAYEKNFDLAWGSETDFTFDSNNIAIARLNDSGASILWMYGAMYSAADLEEVPADNWNMVEFEQEYNEMISAWITITCPAEQTLIPSGYNFPPCIGWSNGYATPNDGLTGIRNNMFKAFDTPSVIQFGTTEGFVVDAADSMGDHHMYSTKNDIVYHYDPSDVTKTKNISPVGTNVPESGVNTMMTDKVKFPVLVVNGSIIAPEGAEVYSINGARVNPSAVNAGVYVVRYNNSAVKVLVK